jgi:hypothetical protein
MNIKREHILNHDLKVSVYDHNQLHSVTLIGTGTISLLHMISTLTFSKEMELEIELYDNNISSNHNKSSSSSSSSKNYKNGGILSRGHIILNCCMSNVINREKLKIRNNYQNDSILKIKKIVGKHLFQRSSLSSLLLHTIIPKIEIKYNTWNIITTKNESEDIHNVYDPIWDNIYYESSDMMITAEQILSIPLIINLYDDSTLVATGTLSNLLYPASLPLKENSSSNSSNKGTDKKDSKDEKNINSNNDPYCEEIIQLYDVKTKKTLGRVKLTLSVSSSNKINIKELVSKAEEEIYNTPLTYDEAVLLITNIKAENLVNTEMFGGKLRRYTISFMRNCYTVYYCC